MSTPPGLVFSQFTDILQANEGLIVAIALFVLPAMVLTVVGLIMRSAGASRRPLVFIGGLIGAIATCFLVAELVRARIPPAKDTPVAGLGVSDGRFVERGKLFGPDVRADLIRDAKTGLPGILDGAEAAESGVTMTGETVLIAQFLTEEQARNAAASYHRAFQLREVSGDERSGWRARRSLQGDFIEMLRTGRVLFVWSGLTKEACAARRSALDMPAQFPSLLPAEQPPLFPALQDLGALFQSPLAKLLGLLSMVVLPVLYFFKGAAWAGSVPAVAGKPPIPGHELAARLQAINQLDAPFTIAPGRAPGEFVADWRYADAKWADLAGVHGMKRTFRIRLTLDEKTHTVRATDYTGSLDWSAGRSGAGIEWKAAVGIVFFQAETQKVYGLRLDDCGRFTTDTSYSYRFNLSEMKSPIITAVTHSGWKWRPTLWQGPAWLRWLTE